MSDWPVTVNILRDATLNGVLYGGGTGVSTSVTVAPTSGQFLGEVAGVPTWKALSAVSLTSGVSGILPIANGGTGASTLAGANIALTTGNLSQFATTTSAQLAGIISDETGSGILVFNTSPTLVTPLLGTPTSGNLSNCTALPISSGISGLASGIATFLATPSSANLAAAITDETGSGALVFATSPTLVTPTLGVATGTRLGLGNAADGTVILVMDGVPNQHHIRLASYSGLQATGSSAQFWLMSNNYFDGTNYKYITTFQASQIFQHDGIIDFKVATSGTAGNNITWLTGLSINNSGNIELNAGKISKYNNITVVGQGVPSIYGSGRSTAQTSAVASVATYTNGASDGSFIVSANVNVTTSTAHNFTVNCTYTDETNTSRTLILAFVQIAGTIVSAISNVTGAGPYEGIPVHIRVKASTAITISTASSFTTVTYNVEGYITQIG